MIPHIIKFSVMINCYLITTCFCDNAAGEHNIISGLGGLHIRSKAYSVENFVLNNPSCVVVTAAWFCFTLVVFVDKYRPPDVCV